MKKNIPAGYRDPLNWKDAYHDSLFNKISYIDDELYLDYSTVEIEEQTYDDLVRDFMKLGQEIGISEEEVKAIIQVFEGGYSRKSYFIKNVLGRRMLHREDGPALYSYLGTIDRHSYYYYYCDKLHRLDGPAKEYSPDENLNEYYVSGIRFSEEDYPAAVKEYLAAKERFGRDNK